MCIMEMLNFLLVATLPTVLAMLKTNSYQKYTRCCFTSQVNSYSHGGTVGSPNQTFFLDKLEQAVNQYFVHILSLVTDNKVSKGAKIRNRYNQVPHLTQDTNGKVTNSQLDTTNVSQEVSPFQAGDHKAHKNRRAQRHSKHKTEQKHKNIKDQQKKLLYRLGTVSKIFYRRA